MTQQLIIQTPFGYYPIFTADPISELEFYGNPYVLITSIDTSSGIEVSRQTGTTPMFVQVSAENILATGSTPNYFNNPIRPYEDLEYQWDFGDPSGVESIFNPVTNQYVNPNTSQIGPEAAYVYRNSGIYTITLNIRGKSSSGYISETVTTNITVTNYTPAITYYFDSVSGNDSNSGLSSSLPKQTISSLSSIPASGRFFLARGGSYNYDKLTNSHTRFAAYGTGVAPIMRFTGANGLYFNIGSPNQNFQNIVFSDITFMSAAADRLVFSNISNYTNTFVNDIYFDNCYFLSESGKSNTVQLTSNSSRWGWWNVTHSAGTNNITTEFFGGFSGRWIFFMGNIMASGRGTPSVVASLGRATGHNIYTGDQNNYLVRYCSFGSGAVDRLFNLNINNSKSVGNYTYHYNFSDCDFQGHWGAIDLSNTNNSRWSNGYIDKIVIDRNIIHDMSKTSPIIGAWTYPNNSSPTIWSYSSENSTFRNNYFYNLPAGTTSLFAWPDAGARPLVYNNIIPSSYSVNMPSSGYGYKTNNDGD